MNARSCMILVFCSLALTGCREESGEPEVEMHAAEIAVARSLATVNPEENLHLFDYDRSYSLEIIETGRLEHKSTHWIDFTFNSPLGGRVPARMMVPRGRGPFPGLLLMHGSDGDIELFSELAEKYARLGSVVLMIESPHIRPGGRSWTGTMGDSWPYFTEHDRRDQIQLMVDLRRAIDILSENPHVDSDRLAYIGYSYGAAMGGLLAGIEDRLKAYVLVVGDGGLTEHMSEPLENGLPDQFRTHWVDSMWPIEPIHYVGRAAPAGLLYQNGLRDSLVSPSDAVRFQIAGSQPKTVIWYDAGHDLTLEAFRDAAVWLQGYIGESLLWMKPDYHPSAIWGDRLFSLWILLSVISSILLVWRERTRSGYPAFYAFFWALIGLTLGPLGLLCHSLVTARSGRVGLVANRADAGREILGWALYAGIIYLLGGLAGNLLSFHFLQGDYLVLTYLTSLLLGWILFWLARHVLPIPALLWLTSVNLLWACDVILADPLMQLWRLNFMLHPRLIWYVASLTLIHTVVLCLLFHSLRGYVFTGGSDHMRGIGRQRRKKLAWHGWLGILLGSFSLDFIAVVYLLAMVTGSSFYQVLGSLPEYFS